MDHDEEKGSVCMQRKQSHRLVITNDDFVRLLLTKPDVNVLDQWLTSYGRLRLDEANGVWIIGPAGFPIADWPQRGHPDASGNTPFWLQAPRLGFAEITERMVSHYKCNLEGQDKNGSTALHFAAYFGHTNVVSILLKLGANPANKNNSGKTALDSAKAAQEAQKSGRFKFPKIGKSARFDRYRPDWEGVLGLLTDKTAASHT